MKGLDMKREQRMARALRMIAGKCHTVANGALRRAGCRETVGQFRQVLRTVRDFANEALGGGA